MDFCKKCKGEYRKVGRFIRCPDCELFCQNCGEKTDEYHSKCGVCNKELKLSQKVLVEKGGKCIFWFLLCIGLAIFFYYHQEGDDFIFGPGGQKYWFWFSILCLTIYGLLSLNIIYKLNREWRKQKR